MCGINIIYHNNRLLPQRPAIEAMNCALAHRGPDGDGVLLRDGVALGHRRLSIVDVAGGAQPMRTNDGRFAIVFNGEIYNYQALRAELEDAGVVLQSHSDTEVILHLYRRLGAACVHRLRGMFAFAVHDAESGALFVARDRLGIKPLFYHWDGVTLTAASEAKALFASGLVKARLNRKSVANYFTYQFAIAPNTLFEGVLELPPGHHLSIVPEGEPVLHRYWDLDFPLDNEYESLEEDYWLDKFRAAMDEATATHTIGEVPIGAYLSGGIDSSVTTYLLTQHYARPVQSFSIHFTNPDHDESPQYRAIAAHLGVANTELSMDDDRPQGYLADLIRCLYHLEQPQRMAVDIPHFLLSGMVREQNYKVVYTGDGADEILAGYDCFRQDMMRTWSNEHQHTYAQRRKIYLTEYTQWFSRDQMEMRLRLHSKHAQQSTIKRFGFYPAWLDFWEIMHGTTDGLFTESFRDAQSGPDQMDSLLEQIKPRLHGRHPLNQSLYLETKTRLPGWILWKSDRLSMAHSVEARVPFMDHPLVELAARMPPELKLNGLDEKYALKKSMAPHLPELPTQYKKRGFYTPIREWFFTPERYAELSPYLSEEALKQAGMFEPAAVDAIYQRLSAYTEMRDMNDYFQVMRLEWTLMTVLSVQILHRLFVLGEAVP